MILKIYNSINFLEKALTMALVLAFLLNIKKVVVMNVLGGESFNEYLDISIYAFDIFFVLWVGIIIPKHNKDILSIFRKVFHVEQYLKRVSGLIVIYVIWQWISLYWSEEPLLALRNVITLSEIIIFILAQVILMFHVEQKKNNENVPRGTYVFFGSYLWKPLVIFALFNAFIIFIQFITQHSLGIFYLGESYLQVGHSGVATINILGEKILRGYGLFVHPNIAGTFIGLTLILGLIQKNVPRGTIENEKITKMFHVEHWMYLVLVFAGILTFSRTAIGMTILASLIIVPRGTFLTFFKIKNKKQMFHVEHLLLGALILAFILGISSFKSLSERELTLVQYVNMDNQSVFGSGVGSYAVDLYSKLISTQPWSIQPIHNFFLLNYYELGLFSLFIVSMLFLMLIKQTTYKKNQLFHVEQSRASYWRGGLVLFIVVVACMDHFFYTIPQGQIILWLGVGFLLTAKTDID